MFKRNKLLVITGILLILFVFLGISLWTKAHFLLDKELIVYLSPNEKSISLHYGEKVRVSFEITSENLGFCRALCAHKFIDRSQNLVLDSGSFNISNKETIQKSYEIFVNRLGTGQDLYNFEVICKNRRTFLCPAQKEGGGVFRSSLIIVNYELSELEKELKAVLKENVTRLLIQLADADKSLQELNQKVFDVASEINLGNLSLQKIEINNRFEQLVIDVENLRSVWASENYAELNKLFNQSFFEELESIRGEINSLSISLNETIINHNYIVMQAKNYADNYNNINFLSKTSILEGKEILEEAVNISDEFNILIIALKDKSFRSYDEFKNKVKELVSRQGKQIETINNLSLPFVLGAEHLYKSEEDLLCLLSNCSNAISVEPATRNIEALYSSKKLSEPETIGAECGKLKNIAKEFKIIKGNSINITKGKNMFPNTEEFKAYAALRLESLTIARDNLYINSLMEIKNKSLFNSFIIDSYSYILPLKKTSSFVPNSDLESLNMTLYHFSVLQNSEKIDANINKTCATLGVPALPKLYSYDYDLVPVNLTYNISSQIVAILSDNQPMCCVFRECKPCCNDESCKNDPSTFPIILLHGHAVVGDSPVEYSLDAYNKLQHKLQEDGYINAGILSLYNAGEGVKEGEWGISGRPVTVRVSYYYDTFKKDEKYIVVPTKSETIDTYAVRLKDIVESVKKRAGKPKVSIIANSMGGLVARRYMQIFGDSSVHKLIMTGTPNKGIVGKVKDLCPVLGESLECRDMQENSLFLNVLNDPVRQPGNVKMYIIAGSGCNTNGKDGDGIVVLENALMPNAKPFVVKAKEPCEFGKYLHTELLDIGKYPEVYKVIREVLRE